MHRGNFGSRLRLPPPSHRPMHPSRSLFAVVVSLLPVASAYAAGPIKAESTIAAVTVYVDRAIVTRTATVELPEGTQEILFAALPDSLDPDLLQVSGSGTAEAMILEVRAVADQLEAPANPRLKELQEQLRTIQAELRVLTDRDAALKLERALLERITIAATTPPEEGGVLPTVEQWQRLTVFYAEGLARIATRVQEIDHEKEGVQSRLSAVQREIGELQPQSAQAVQDVVVRVDVTKAGSLDLKLAYTVDDAAWSPTYDVRVTSATKKISLGYSAMVRQSTGEDWHAVKLTLSTARPAIGGTPPELSPWYVAKAEPRMFARAMNAAAPAAGAAADAAEEKMVLSAFTVSAASVEAGLTAATFTVTHPSDIPADNAEHKIPITAHELDAELTHLSVPKLAELAYLRAAVTNTSTYPLISGPVNLYLDGTFVARSQLRTVMPNEKFDLDLGVDDGVAVKRQLRNRLTEDTGLVSSKEQITYDVLITVQNNRPTLIKLVVKDQLPVSKHERIVVELLDPPSRQVKPDEDGTLTWTLDLNSGEKRELPLKIAVEYPSDLAVEGLE
jgi:uncharacterized protein (TIGR02231 family)